MFSRPRAREEQEYTFAKQQYPPIPLTLVPTHLSFCAPLPRTGALLHFTLIIRSSLLLRPRLRLRPTSLAASLFLFLASLSQLA
jgi:hypothetical protein